MLTIAWITLRRITERSVLVQFGVLALVLAYVALGLDAVLLSDAAGSEQSGVNVVWVFLTAFTIFWTTIEIPREVGRKEVQVYLSKPVTRLRYMLGKFLGMAGMVVAGEVVLLTVFAVCLLVKGQRPTAAFYFTAVRTGLFLVFLNALCTAASVGLPEVFAMMFVAVVAAAGVVACVLPVLAWSSFFRGPSLALLAAYHLVPDLLHYRWDPTDGRLLGYLGALLLYTAGWSTIFLLAGHVILKRRDLS